MGLNISGGCNSDLSAYLKAPDVTTLVQSMFKPKASGPGMNITLSDAGSTSIQSETSGSVLTGTYRAEVSLADFTGLAADVDKSSSIWLVSGAGLDTAIPRRPAGVCCPWWGTMPPAAGTSPAWRVNAPHPPVRP